MRRQSLIYGIALAALPALPRLHSYHTAPPHTLPTTLHSYCPPRHTYITLRVVACYILTLWSHIYINIQKFCSTTRISHIIGVCQKWFNLLHYYAAVTLLYILLHSTGDHIFHIRYPCVGGPISTFVSTHHILTLTKPFLMVSPI